MTSRVPFKLLGFNLLSRNGGTGNHPNKENGSSSDSLREHLGEAPVSNAQTHGDTPTQHCHLGSVTEWAALFLIT